LTEEIYKELFLR